MPTLVLTEAVSPPSVNCLRMASTMLPATRNPVVAPAKSLQNHRELVASPYAAAK